MKNIDFSYETDANDSFLVATLPSDANLIQNQVKMLLHNSDIPHILEMRLYHEDETARLRYTVTAKITLEQALLRRQMNRSEFVALLLDLLECFRELPDYQLTPRGLCLDEKHIFVESGNFHPYFVYLPIYREDSDLGYLRKFVQDMIVNCRVVSQNDDFTQRMLTLFNEQDLTVDRIQQQLRKLERPTDPDSGSYKKQPFPLNPPKKQASVLRERTPASSPDLPIPPKPPSPPLEESHKPPKTGKPTPTNTRTTSKPPKSKPVKNGSGRAIFLALQGVWVVLLALALQRGFFLQDGAWNVSYIAGFAMLALVVDYVVYRELLQDKSGGKTSSSSGKKRPGGKGASQKDKSVRRPAPEKKKSDLRDGYYRPGQPLNQEQPHSPAPSVPLPSQPPISTPPPFVMTPIVPDNSTQEPPTIVGSSQSEQFREGVLEYYENGLIRRIHLQEGITQVGRSRNMDYSISDLSVSRAHAEFIRRGNQYFVKDMNSSGGTYINDSNNRVVSNQETEIFSGDTIRLADVKMTFQC